MPSTGKKVVLGPFKGGLNLYSDAAAIADDELVECLNFELDIDGSMKCRPPMQSLNFSVGIPDRIYVIGNGIINGVPYVFGSCGNGVYKFTANTWTLIVANLFSVKSIQFRNKIFFFAHAISPIVGGVWDGTTYTSLPLMPRGEGAVVYKNRLWVTPAASGANGSRLSFSDVLDPTIWNAPDFFDVAPGDGELLVDLVVFNNNLLLFKQSSTHALSYDTRPTDAVITKISNSIGATSNNCVAESENEIYVYHQGEVYQFINYEWIKVSLKVPFEYDDSTPVGKTRYEFVKMCFIGTNRLLVRYYNRMYVFNTHTRAWFQWKSENDVLNNVSHFVRFPDNSIQNVNTAYIGGSCLGQDTQWFTVHNGWNSFKTETHLGAPVNIKCRVTTKNYSMETPYTYKRLYWWGVEAGTTKQVTGTVNPVVVGPPAFSVTTVIPNTETGSFKRYFKFPKSLRFRQINFSVELWSDGSTNDGPAALYTIIPVVGNKQTVATGVT